MRIKATGLLAEALEHEIGHLRGILYVDHVESEEKLRRVGPIFGVRGNNAFQQVKENVNSVRF